MAFLTCGLDCKLTIKNSIQRQHTAVTVAPVVIQRNGQPLPAPAPAVAYALKFDKPILSKQNSCVRPCILNAEYSEIYRMLRGFGSLAKSDC